MADVRSTKTVPGLPLFFASDGTPIVIDRMLGNFYALLQDQTIIDLRTRVAVGQGLWDDLRFPATATRQGALAKPDFDYTNIGLLFPQNDPTEIIYMIDQLPHTYTISLHDFVSGTDFYPHVHFLQTSAAIPVFNLEYKWYNAGEAPPAAFTTITTTGLAIPYVSGNLAQVAVFPAIAGTGKEASSFLKMKLYRTDNVVTGDVLVDEFDIHYQSFTLGTKDAFPA